MYCSNRLCSTLNSEMTGLWNVLVNRDQQHMDGDELERKYFQSPGISQRLQAVNTGSVSLEYTDTGFYMITMKRLCNH